MNKYIQLLNLFLLSTVVALISIWMDYKFNNRKLFWKEQYNAPSGEGGQTVTSHQARERPISPPFSNQEVE